MHIFKFSVTDFPEKRAYAVLGEMEEKRGGAIGMFCDSVGADCYLGLPNLVDANEFRRRLQAIGVEFTELNELPAEIRKTTGFKVATRILGLG